MDFLLTVIFMVVVGAIIGGFTNSLAIKMLFRPHNPVYIGKWRVPFTPGLIPKRREELAKQLGIMVVEHLLTPESIQKKFLNESFQKELTSLVQRELERMLNSDETLQQLFARLGYSNGREMLEGKIDDYLEKKYYQLMQKYRHHPIKDILSKGLIDKIESKIPLVSSYILKKGSKYFSSMEGELRIERMIDDFIKQRSGMVGNMLQMFLGNVNMTDKIQKEIIKFLESEGTKDLVTTLLQKEWEKVLNWEVEEAEVQFGRENLTSTIKTYVRKVIRVDRIFANPISDLSTPIRNTVLDTIVPYAIQTLSSWLSNRIEAIMEKLRLEDIVRDQVETFSVERIEEMVLLITSRELKMITYLGALLGGLIGLFQGVLVYFTS